MSIVIGTAGHIDHGKSALVRALTGIDPDRLKEEKARGITIDIGFAHADIGGSPVSFVDVPGHERFVKNMLAGVGGIDAVLLVVAADESVMPQTREHFDICRLLRIPAGVIAITKADLADAETLGLTTIETRELVAGTFLEHAPIVPVSVITGAGLDNLRSAIGALPARSRTDRGFVRMPIDRVFSMKGFGTVVTGTLVSGELHQETDLIVAPSGCPVKVRSLQVHGAASERVSAGHRVAANLVGVEVAEVSRGDTLLSRGTLAPTRIFDASIEPLASTPTLKHGARVRVHQGTAEILGRISVVTGTDVRIRLEAPAILARGDRFILRAYSPPTTIAGGEVLDPHPPRIGVRTEAGRLRFRKIAPDASVDRVATVLIEESGAGGLQPRALVERAGVAVDDLRPLIRRVQESGTAVDLGEILVASGVLDTLASQVIDELRAHHAAQPLSAGMAREELRTRRFARAHETVFATVLDRLSGTGQVVARDRVALGTHRVQLSPDEERAKAALNDLFERAGLRPPLPGEAAREAGVAEALGGRMVQLLVRERVLVKAGDLLFHRDALARLKADLAALKSAAGPVRVDVASFKEKYGVSRKFAIPLLEYLDRERVTRRQGDSRVVL
jgi:selenocysteine-specific elongation factor